MKDCRSDQIINPKTGRCVLKTGKIGQQILKEMENKKENKTEVKLPECKPDQILNPKTGRCVSKNGKIGKKLLESKTDKEVKPKREVKSKPKREVKKVKRVKKVKEVKEEKRVFETNTSNVFDVYHINRLAKEEGYDMHIDSSAVKFVEKFITKFIQEIRKNISKEVEIITLNDIGKSIQTIANNLNLNNQDSMLMHALFGYGIRSTIKNENLNNIFTKEQNLDHNAQGFFFGFVKYLIEEIVDGIILNFRNKDKISEKEIEASMLRDQEIKIILNNLNV